MSVRVHVVILSMLIGAPAAVFGAAAPGAKPAAESATKPTPPASAAKPTPPPPDPVLAALHAEVERLRKSAAEAEAAAPDEAARVLARQELITQLLLVLIRQQEQVYLQNQALLGALARPSAGATAAPPAPRAATAAATGPLYGKRDGDKVHRPGCRAGEMIAASTRLGFASLAQAAAAGYRPCQICRPDRP